MASGETLLALHPWADDQIATNFATKSTRNAHPILDYDNTVAESAVWTLLLPRNYAGGGLTVDVYFTAPTVVVGNVTWEGAIERIGVVQDLDVDGFAAAQSSGAVAVSGTSGVPVKAIIVFTDGAQMDSLAAGEPFRFKLTRDASGIAEDAEFVYGEIRET